MKIWQRKKQKRLEIRTQEKEKRIADWVCFSIFFLYNVIGFEVWYILEQIIHTIIKKHHSLIQELHVRIKKFHNVIFHWQCVKVYLFSNPITYRKMIKLNGKQNWKQNIMKKLLPGWLLKQRMKKIMVSLIILGKWIIVVDV